MREEYSYFVAEIVDGKVTELYFLSMLYELEVFKKKCADKGADYQVFDVAPYHIAKHGMQPARFCNTAFHVRGKSVPVMCVETGEVFKNIIELKNKIGDFSRWTLDLRVKNGLPINGQHYIFLDKDE